MPDAPAADPRRSRLLLGSMITTFLVVRLLLWRSPDSDFKVAGHNVHHLFTGLLPVVAGGVPVVRRARDPRRPRSGT